MIFIKYLNNTQFPGPIYDPDGLTILSTPIWKVAQFGQEKISNNFYCIGYLVDYTTGEPFEITDTQYTDLTDGFETWNDNKVEELSNANLQACYNQYISLTENGLLTKLSIIRSKYTAVDEFHILRDKTFGRNLDKFILYDNFIELIPTDNI